MPMTWISFAFSAIVLTLFLFVPGALVLKATRFSAIEAISFAPIVSGAAYALLAIAFPYLGIAASWASLFLPCLAVGAAALGVRALLGRRGGAGPRAAAASRDGKQAAKRQWAIFLLYPLLGIAAFSWLLLAQLPGPDAVIQQIDNTFHVSLIHAFAEARDYSTLHCTLFPDVAQGSYYPALFHEFGAMVMSATGCSAGAAENVVLLVCVGIAFPCGMHTLLAALVPENEPTVLAGAFATVLFKGFAANMLIWTVMPNVLSYCFIPAAIAALVKARNTVGAKSRIAYLAPLLLSCAALVLAHPLGLFAFVVLVYPYCLMQVWLLPLRPSEKLPRPRLIKALMVVGILLATALLWYTLYYSPYLIGVTNMMWPGFATPMQAVIQPLFLAYRPIPTAQPLLALAVFAGIAYTVRNRKHLWLSIAFVLASFIYGVGVGSNGIFKQILTGYWYTDTIRIGGFAAIAAMPLATFGFAWLGGLLARLTGKRTASGSASGGTGISGGKGTAPSSRLAWQHVATCAVLAIVIALPNSLVPFASDPMPTEKGDYHPGDFTRTESAGEFASTAFSAAQTELRALANLSDNVLTQTKIDFGKKVAETVPSDARIINSPFDGSMFLYSLDGLNLCYRRNSATCPYIEDGKLVRTHLDECATNAAVRAAVKDAGIQYVLLLDSDNAPDAHRIRYQDYYPDEWVGIDHITDETPGFEPVLSDGAMRLYKIL